ncbi:Tigger transposable element-derived protein 4 [Trichinella sp. T9]|nr:Tigger transposable element-derived protein 4 [Trichinella sp. T9]
MTSHNCGDVTNGAEQKRIVLLIHHSVLLRESCCHQCIERWYKKCFSFPAVWLITVKNPIAILDAHENGITSANKFRLCKKTDTDESLLEWFQEQSQIGTPISGPISTIKAEQFATMLGFTDFTCTTGWLDRSKAGHNICCGRLY